MFTFGKDKEIKHAIWHVGDEQKAKLLIDVIDKVHDFLEKKATYKETSEAIYLAIENGGSGVWESSGNWLSKISHDYPKFSEIWEKLSRHRLAKVRLRVAGDINSLSKSIFLKTCKLLLSDKSAKVRSMTAEKLSFSKNPDVLSLLKNSLKNEKNEEVMRSIKYAIEEILEND